ncbi:molybdopterin-dependent oxidoreductase [Pseudarthrobacter sp. J1738]|uniref:molybdopterin-dependent oxidoreductase n=1 Tax=Pseudarthrobacter sp. J1738 TaxID=3420446 RepID=UPI003D2C94AB
MHKIPTARLKRWAAVSGVVAVGGGVAVGELVAAIFSPSLSPITAVGGAVIDSFPPGVKDWAVGLFGTADKLVFIMVLCAVLLGMAVIAGVAEFSRRWAGVAIVAVFGAIGIAGVASRSGSSAPSLLLPVLDAVLAAVLLTYFSRAAQRSGMALGDGSAPAVSAAPAPAAATAARRKFLGSLAFATAAGAVAAIAAGTVRSAGAVTTSARNLIRLPKPAVAAKAPAVSANINLPGLTPLVTDNANFYRIDTALVVPFVNPDGWKLRITGMVDHQLEFTLDQILAMPMIEQYITIACVSNEVGGDLIGNARWLGVPVKSLLAQAGVQPGANMIFSTSVDGFTASTPLEAMTDGRAAVLAVGMNGEPLPAEHGFPARLIVPGLYGFVSATKWISEIKVSSFGKDVAYWSTRGWSDHGPIKMSSRIDTPRPGAVVTAGELVLGGMAWAQGDGVSAVQVRVDGGEWIDAVLATGISKNTWVQWRATVTLAVGAHNVQARAKNVSGQWQIEAETPVAPDGSTGLHTVNVTAK